MTGQTPSFDQLHGTNDPFGLAKFSIRRSSVQYLLVVLVVIGLLIAANIQAALHGNTTLRVLAGTILALTLASTAFLIFKGNRTVAVEEWIRRLGMGDFEFRIEPWGHDEVSKACEALETLRQSSIRAMQLDLVQELSDELREKNAELQRTLEELRSAQDRIISQQKLAELGELSAGVAHEIRNPLQFIRNFAGSSQVMIGEIREMARGPGPEDPEEIDELTRDIGENMQRIVNHTDRADRIIADMLAMGRRSTGTFGPVDLNGLLEDQARLAHQAVQAQLPGFSAKIRYDIEPDLGDVHAVEEDLARLFTNLVTNACHAMVERADVSEDGYQPELRLETVRTPEGVAIRIRDNGVGMSPDVMSRIFNPFFTTKAGNRHTGLGMTLSHEVVREHGGRITAMSEPGEYTTMTVVLPGTPATRNP
ncbi:MAG: ATP-binding protein [bacterium]|nr:ATP-binding protein [bacterium]MDE0289172.1 ATP-binding protein [bacterium]MDE0377213.1 ATP-binding protein [bacterium]